MDRRCMHDQCSNEPGHHVWVWYEDRRYGIRAWPVIWLCDAHFGGDERLFRKLEATGHAAIDTPTPPASAPTD